MPDPKFPIPLRQLPIPPGQRVENVKVIPPIAYRIERMGDGTFDVLVDEPKK